MASLVLMNPQNSPAMKASAITPPDGPMRMSDVARIAGVSLVTVSRAVNQPDKVAPATLAAVRAAIDTLGYVPNQLAGGLASNRSRTIAAMVPTLSNLVFSETIEAMSLALNARGYQVLLAQTNYCAADEIRIVDTFLGRRVDGMALMGITNEDVADKLRRAVLPVVQTWDFSSAAIDMQVGFSNADAGHKAGVYLAGQGHRVVGFIGADERRSRLRLKGFRRAFSAVGGQVVVSLAPPPAGADTAAAQLADLRRHAPAMTAVFCNNDLLAAALLFECQRLRLKVPQQMAVMGFGDLPVAGACWPRLTTVSVPRRRMGEVAAELLLRRLAGDPSASTVDLGFTVVPRESA